MAKPSLLSRVGNYVARLFRRAPPEPGRFVAGVKFAWRGFLAGAPWILPRREYLVYVPSGHSRWRRTPLLVLIHGCRQKPEDIAGGTRIAALADELGCLVLLPRQAENANPWGCWNWFDRATVRGWGETALVTAQIIAVRRGYWIDRKRVFLAGMSAGGALAAAIALRRPQQVAGVFIHSGIACGAASSPVAAMNVLTWGADTDVVAIAQAAREKASPHALPVPLVAIQGGRDDMVKPINAAQLVRQFLALNAHPAAKLGERDALPPPDKTRVATMDDGRTITTSEWLHERRLVARHVLIAELGHAWSGGDDRYPFNDAHGPDATALLGAFMHGR